MKNICTDLKKEKGQKVGVQVKKLTDLKKEMQKKSEHKLERTPTKRKIEEKNRKKEESE